MAAQRVALAFLITGMLTTGVANSLLSKAQDMVCVGNCSDPDTSKHREFSQPIIQTLTMFMGEATCYVALMIVLRQRGSPGRPHGHADMSKPLASAEGPSPNSSAIVLAIMGEDGDQQSERIEGKKSFYFLVPAMCDIVGTTLMNVGLLMTPVSIYQMVRGALVLWVGLFSVLFLHRPLSGSQWAALSMVMLGVAVVGLSGSLAPQKTSDEIEALAGPTPTDPGRTALGIGLILFAQIFTASQFVFEEKIMMRYACEPLRAVGLEGIFGATVTAVVMVLAHLFIGRTEAGRGGVFDLVNGLHEVFDIQAIWIFSILIAASIGLFNMFGLAVTRTLSSAARSTLDTSRTILIALASVALGWESLKALQVVGFVLVAYGTFVFNEVLAFPSIPHGVLQYEHIPYVHVEDEDDEEAARARSTVVDPQAEADGSGSTRPRARRTESVKAAEVARRSSSREASPLLMDRRNGHAS